MPLGIVSDKEFESQLESIHDSFNKSIPLVDNIPPRALEIPTENNPTVLVPSIVDSPTAGRNKDVLNIPQSLRKIVAETTFMEGAKRANDLLNGLGVNGLHQPTLSKLANGVTTFGKETKNSKDITNHLNNRKTKISNRALNKINLALANMSAEKFEELEMRELSAIAKDMAEVAKKMEPSKSEEDKKEPVQWVVYAPQIKQENHYEQVVAKDNY